MSPPRAATVSAWQCVLLEKSPGWGIGLGGISCSIYCRVLHSATLALSLARIRREFAFAEYGYLQPMQELFASRRKIFRCASSCWILYRPERQADLRSGNSSAGNLSSLNRVWGGKIVLE